MTRSRPSTPVRLVAWILATLTVFLGCPTLARAENVTVAVELTRLRLTGTRPDDQVILNGRVVNNGASPAFGVRVILWRSRDPIRDSSVLDTVVSGQNVPWGDRLNRSTDHYFRVTDSTTSLDPGQSATFTVRATLADLGLTATGAAYVFGVQVVGTPDASSNFVTIGRARTLLAVPGKQQRPLTSIVAFSSAPAGIRPNVFLDDHLAAELQGRLEALLTEAERPGVSWLIDPSLYEELTDMADGYQVMEGDQLKDGTGASLAAAWLGRFAALPSSRGGRTLYGNPDVTGAAIAGAVDVLQRSLAASASVEALDDLPLVVLPAGGRIDERTVKYLRPAKADAVVASTAGGGSPLATGSGTPLLRVASLTAAGPGTEDGPVQRSQRLLAEAVVGRGQARLLTSEADIAAARAASPRWLAPSSLETLLASAPAEPPAALMLPAKNPRLGRVTFASIDELAGDLTAFSDLVPESVLAGRSQAILSKAASGSWIGVPGSRYLRAVQSAVGKDAVSKGVRLNATPRFLMSSRTNYFPLTITNELAESIRVRVIVTSENPARLTIPSSELVTVAPGESHTVNIRPEGTSNGIVGVTAHVASESGRRVTPNTRITVEVTELGIIGWVIVIASGVVLVVATGWRIRQVRRQQHEEQE